MLRSFTTLFIVGLSVLSLCNAFTIQNGITSTSTSTSMSAASASASAQHTRTAQTTLNMAPGAASSKAEDLEKTIQLIMNHVDTVVNKDEVEVEVEAQVQAQAQPIEVKPSFFKRVRMLPQKLPLVGRLFR